MSIDFDQAVPINPPPPPPILHMADFRLALLAAGLLEQVETFMAGPDVSPECKILWEYATQVHRDDQYLNQMAGAMGFTDADLDAVFGIGGNNGE